MPSAHRFVSEWSAEYFVRRAKVVGPHTIELFQAMFRTKDHPEQAYRSCQGILALAQQQGHAATEKACFEALERRQYNYAFIYHQLHQKRAKSTKPKVLAIPDDHQNLRRFGLLLKQKQSDPLT